ncbi:MAG: glyoxalase [Lachnospiraceae bacterium]|nr:glyoxalase [Agathobacter sp.]MDD6446078.1 glyoxalase [Lachnospiraceae bacterium]MDY4893987.1 glyoxalase [Agathobacter sp.]
MNEYDDEILNYFLENQRQLFPENVAETPEEAGQFLEDCMAVVCSSLKEVKDYLDEAGMDVSGMDREELLAASEVFSIPDGRFLIVEG